MEITRNRTGDSCELMVRGRIDGAAANALEVELLAILREGAKEVFINLTQAESLCSAGIRVILQYYRQMKGAGKRLLVTRPSPEVDAVLEMTGFRDQIVEKAGPAA